MQSCQRLCQTFSTSMILGQLRNIYIYSIFPSSLRDFLSGRSSFEPKRKSKNRYIRITYERIKCVRGGGATKSAGFHSSWTLSPLCRTSRRTFGARASTPWWCRGCDGTRAAAIPRRTPPSSAGFGWGCPRAARPRCGWCRSRSRWTCTGTCTPGTYRLRTNLHILVFICRQKSSFFHAFTIFYPIPSGYIYRERELLNKIPLCMEGKNIFAYIILLKYKVLH